MKCPVCKGSGREKLPSAYPRFRAVYTNCDACKGTGKKRTKKQLVEDELRKLIKVGNKIYLHENDKTLYHVRGIVDDHVVSRRWNGAEWRYRMDYMYDFKLMYEGGRLTKK